jgi:hypothetical protein
MRYRAVGPGDVHRVAQFDKRMISAEIAERLWVYGGADGAVKFSGRSQQILGLEHAICGS